MGYCLPCGGKGGCCCCSEANLKIYAVDVEASSLVSSSNRGGASSSSPPCCCSTNESVRPAEAARKMKFGMKYALASRACLSAHSLADGRSSDTVSASIIPTSGGTHKNVRAVRANVPPYINQGNDLNEIIHQLISFVYARCV